jgi:hypothetical protein
LRLLRSAFRVSMIDPAKAKCGRRAKAKNKAFIAAPDVCGVSLAILMQA